PEFRSASAVAQFGLSLADARPVTNGEGLAWAGGRCKLAIVNHVPHVRYAQKLTAAPIVLETHHIFSDLIDTHGIATSQSSSCDRGDARESEERQIWREVAGCVNLTAREHEIISPHARAAWLVKPYARQRQPRQRTWPDVLKANKLSWPVATSDEFDVLLWGT